jgi:hypothetical protein
MTEQSKDQISPATIDVGLSPDHDGVVSIFETAAGQTVIMTLPPDAALAYARALYSNATRLLAGEKPATAAPPRDSIAIKREQPSRLDS